MVPIFTNEETEAHSFARGCREQQWRPGPMLARSASQSSAWGEVTVRQRLPKSRWGQRLSFGTVRRPRCGFACRRRKLRAEWN